MDELLKRDLGLESVQSFGGLQAGCINDGRAYDTNNGKIFVKINIKNEARLMFDGEFASLEAIHSTGTVKVPSPIKVLNHPSGTGALLVTEYLDMKRSLHASKLGEQLARMHLFNEELIKRGKATESRIGSDVQCITAFGFDVPTCCGFIPQDNTWCDNWVTFYTRERLVYQLDLIERDYSDRQARELWPRLERRIPGLFEGLNVQPALLHGDLWAGNVGQSSLEPVVFDPASFYGHSEFDLGIAAMFGGFSQSFYTAYHKVIPKMAGFDRRLELYKLFHYLNHWNHFGTGYRGSAISIMQSLTT